MNKLLTTLILMSVLNSCNLKTKSEADLQIPNDISLTERIYGISKFWQEVNYNFAYFENIPNVDFDSAYKSYLGEVITAKNDLEYYKVLERFCAELKDGHTNIFYPDYLKQKLFTPPISIRRIKNEIYVVNVGKSYVKIIPRGSQITHVNGQNVLDYLEQNVYPYQTGAEHIIKSNGAKVMLQGLIGEGKTITILKPNSESETVNIIMNGLHEDWYYPILTSQSNDLVVYKKIDENIGYIAINSFLKSEVIKEFIAQLDNLFKDKAVIIDIRQNGGGHSEYADQIIKYFTDKPYFLGELYSTRKHIASYKALGAPPDKNYVKRNGFQRNKYSEYYFNNVWEYEKMDTIYTDVNSKKLLMPIAILISNNTASAAEDFLVGMDYLKRATLIGEKTYGSTGQPIYFELPNGGSCRICTRKCTYPDGRKFVGFGIKPDIEVVTDLSSYLTNKDIVLNEAIRFLNDEVNNSR